MKTRKLLVTSALPYANGPIHLGHLVEYIQSDIWVRFHKLRGINCIFVCADDAHGTPIMISAEKNNMTPEELIKVVFQEHTQDFQNFHIDFDYYYTTHSPENQQLSNLIYQRLWQNDDIAKRTITQAYDPIKQMFLPDRYVKGECPRCGAKDQYGDNCEVCGATYSPAELKNPISILSGTPPIEKESEHYFFKLEKYEAVLKQWLGEGHVQAQILNKLQEWFSEGLAQWDISRDAPYFGFEIPNAPNKYFYVWLDACIGYMSSFKKLCETRPDLNFDEYWDKNSKTELYHFVGKDIIYFHALFWPAMLKGSNFRMPTAIFSHGFLTINGQKMSKSRGTFITAKSYSEYLDPEWLRYYFAAKLNDKIDDIDLNFDDFMQRVNADLVGKVINIASRCAGFLNKFFDNRLANQLPREELFNHFVEKGEMIAQLYTARDYNQAIREIMNLADLANQYIDEMKPWVLAKQNETLASVQAICTQGINSFYVLMIYLKPILPKTAENTEQFLNTVLSWDKTIKPLLDHQIQPFKPLMHRVDPIKIQALLEDQKMESLAI